MPRDLPIYVFNGSDFIIYDFYRFYADTIEIIDNFKSQ